MQKVILWKSATGGWCVRVNASDIILFRGDGDPAESLAACCEWLDTKKYKPIDPDEPNCHTYVKY